MVLHSSHTLCHTPNFQGALDNLKKVDDGDVPNPILSCNNKTVTVYDVYDINLKLIETNNGFFCQSQNKRNNKHLQSNHYHVNYPPIN